MFNIYLTHNRCAEIERYKKEILAIIFLSNIADRFVYHKINFAKLENDEEYNAYIDNRKKVYLKLFNVIENKYGKVNFKKEAAIEIDGDYIGSGAYEYSQKIINDLSCLWLGTKDEKLFEQKVALVRSSFHLKYDGDRYFKETLCALREEERIYEIEFFYNLFENSARSNIFKQIMHMNCPR
jgi:hypothetical protein